MTQKTKIVKTQSKEPRSYLYDILCMNCQKVIWLVVPKGLRIEQYLKINPLCPECGCKIE